MSAGPSTITSGGANACPNGCGRMKTRTATMCQECRAEQKRRDRGVDNRDRLVLARRAAGLSFARIAAELGLSASRTRQVFVRAVVRQQRYGGAS